MKKNAKVELLAPAGSKEGFYGAIHAGADAVYLGGNRFGARAYAENFTEEELIACIRYAHLWGRKVYLTINTLIKESEFSQLYDYIYPYYQAGLDGVIIQDIGVLAFVKEHFPKMELHASTQMTLTTADGVKMLQDMGVCRVVPARELSLSEIRSIKEETGVSIEAFVHGAMCYCYSGQCLFSSILGGRSGNRGRCAQPCRLPYKVQNSKDEFFYYEKDKNKEYYPLSLKDMCTIEHISELIEAGIDSFKIEGRMKKPEYAAGVTAIYRKYIDRYYENHIPPKVSSKDLQKLASLYIRSKRQDGYYYKHNGKDMITLDSPAYSGSDEVQIEQIRKDYIESKPKKPIFISGVFQTGQCAQITILCDDISITVNGDEVQQAGKQPITEENIRKQLGKLGDSIFTVDSSTSSDIEVFVSPDAFYPLGAINALRRQAVALLEDAIIESYGLPTHREENKAQSIDESTNFVDHLSISAQQTGITVSVSTLEQLNAVINNFTPTICRIYVSGDLLLTNPKETIETCQKFTENLPKDATTQIVIALNTILRKSDKYYLDSIFDILEREMTIFTGILVKSLDGMGAVLNRNYKGLIYVDSSFYIWNQTTYYEWCKNPNFAGFCLPVELKGGEQKQLLDVIASKSFPNPTTNTSKPTCEKMIYGRIPMMVTANCVAKTTTGCMQTQGTMQTSECMSKEKTHMPDGTKPKRYVVNLTDRYQKKFPVELNCTHCMNTIYNSVPLSLHGELSKWKKTGVIYRINFTVEDYKETQAIVRFFLGQDANLPFSEYTTGHEKRGVE